MNTEAVMCMALTRQRPSRTPLWATNFSIRSVMLTKPRRLGISNQRYSVSDFMPAAAILLLRVEQDVVVDDHHQIIFAVAGHVGHDGFARFGQGTGDAAEGVLFKDLPAEGGHQFVLGVEADDVQIIFGCFQEYQ